MGLICCALASRAAAQDEWPSDDTAYRELVRKALAEYRRSNWAEAKAYFGEAHARYPNARTLRGLGLAAYGSRDYVTAIGQLEAALAHPVQPLTLTLREQISQLLSQARRFVTRLTATLTPNDAVLRVDERSAERTPDGSVWLNPGTHDLSVTAEGYEPATRRIWVQADTEISVQITLRAAQAEPLPALLPPPPPQPQRRVRPAAPPRESTSVAPYILLGLSSVVAITGGVLLGKAFDDIERLERPRLDTQWSDVERKYRDTPPLSTAGVALIGVGAAGIGASLLWAFWPDPESESLSLQWAPGAVRVRGAL